MDLMEYQGKDLFRRYGIPTTPQGQVATSPEQAEELARGFGVPVMVKYCPDAAAARAAAEAILGLDIKGHVVHKVLVEPASDIAEEYYLSLLHDRVSKGYKAICSVEGGMEIEEVNRTHPEKVAKVDLNPVEGFSEEIGRRICAEGALPEEVHTEVVALLERLYAGFVDADATLFEINPLIRTTDGRIIALDSKVSIDNNALFRHPDLAELEGPGGEDDDDLEVRAKREGLQYVKLDGDVGVLGNGAGLVMSTLDVVAQAGGRPANFLDVGGGADADTMATSLSLVLSDPDVKVVLVNIFGGITRCDLIAEGVLQALGRLGDVPEKLVVRLDGTNAEEGRRILEQAAHPNIVPAGKMLEAAERAVELAASA